MAIFESAARRKPGTRSNTKLIVSGGQSPAGQWVTDPTLPVKFFYDYGGPGQKEVVVGKGMLVGLAQNRYWDDTLGVNKNALTIATDTIRPFGVAPYNFAKHYQDFLDGNLPSVITREFIELPWIPNADDAAAVNYGAVLGNLNPGDLLTWTRDPNNFGKFEKFDSTKHAWTDVIAQVGELETDQNPFGWLQWAMWDETAWREDQQGPPNKIGYVAPGEEGYPFDTDTGGHNVTNNLARMGTNGYLTQYTTSQDAGGIPGLTDGANKAQTVQTRVIAMMKGIAAAFDLGFKQLIQGTVSVMVGNRNLTEVTSQALVTSPDKFYIDYTNGTIVYYIDPTETETNMTVQFRVNFYGTPAGWDFKGAAGVTRILLKF